MELKEAEELSAIQRLLNNEREVVISIRAGIILNNRITELEAEMKQILNEFDEVEAQRDELVEVLEVYKEKAQAIARYMKNSNVSALEACMTELALDEGIKAQAILDEIKQSGVAD